MANNPLWAADDARLVALFEPKATGLDLEHGGCQRQWLYDTIQWWVDGDASGSERFVELNKKFNQQNIW